MSYFRTIKNLKCYYNFFTNKKFELRSFIYSDLKESVPVIFKDSHEVIMPNDYQENESKITKQAINFKILYLKHSKIKKKLQLLSNKKKGKNTQNNVMNINSITINKITDNFCLLKKAKCVHCKIPCRFNLDGVERLTSKLLKEELKLHSHPTSRVINKMNRNKEQEKIELLNHYKTVHFLK